MNENLPYPDNEMMFAEPLPEELQEFVYLCEDLLLNYRFNTARAYRSDLIWMGRMGIRTRQGCPSSQREGPKAIRRPFETT